MSGQTKNFVYHDFQFESPSSNGGDSDDIGRPIPRDDFIGRDYAGRGGSSVFDTSPGRIGFPPVVVSRNVFDEAEANGEKIPGSFTTLRRKYDFHRVAIGVDLQRAARSSGVTQFRLIGGLKGDGPVGGDPALFEDIGPDSSWLDKDVHGEVTAEIGYDWLGALLTLAKIPAPAIGGKASFSWKWSPKVGAVVSGHDGDSAHWDFNRCQGMYLDGDRDLILLIRRPRAVENMTFVVHAARAVFDGKFMSRDSKIEEGLIRIPIRFDASKRA